ncbi:MAG: phenylacetic acid degradation operon negative regulatory protein PaaX [Chloroflexi bacterium]|nr:phenylacetic acid degradation operon negative regulatory protein PaaX [Chloroflexota bacterium]
MESTGSPPISIFVTVISLHDLDTSRMDRYIIMYRPSAATLESDISNRDTRMARPQSMMFTLFGDYIMHRGGEIWVGSLITIAGQFGLSQQAVRSALSRMTQKGWLNVRRMGNHPYYGATGRTTHLLEEGKRRIFDRRSGPWDHRWRILVYSIPERMRDIRTTLRKQLAWLGYAPASSGSWVCPHDVEDDLRGVVSSLGIGRHVETFCATHDGFTSDRELAARCWDLQSINRRYGTFLAKYRPLYESFLRREDVTDSECFVQRFLLIHEYRKFFFIDPELPEELLPSVWHGAEARELFQTFHLLLAERANRYFDSVFEAPPARRDRTGARPHAREAVAAAAAHRV